MSVVPLSLDSKLEPRALLNCVLRDGDILGTDNAGRTALLLILDPWTLHRLLAFDADAADLEDTDGEPEPDQEFDGPAAVLDFVPPKRVVRASRVAQVVSLALFLVAVPYAIARADQAPAITRPLSTVEAPAQCCRICRKSLWRCLYQFDQEVQEGAGLRVLGRQRFVGQTATSGSRSPDRKRQQPSRPAPTAPPSGQVARLRRKGWLARHRATSAGCGRRWVIAPIKPGACR